MIMHPHTEVLYSGKPSWVQTFTKISPDAPEENFVVFTFAPSSMEKPHPQRRLHAWLDKNCYHENKIVAMAAEVTVDAMIRGYHVYRDIWGAVVDKQLTCKREPFNSADPCAVDHVPSAYMPREHHPHT